MIRQNKDEKRQACSTKKQACPFCGVTGIIYSQCTWPLNLRQILLLFIISSRDRLSDSVNIVKSSFYGLVSG